MLYNSLIFMITLIFNVCMYVYIYIYIFIIIFFFSLQCEAIYQKRTLAFLNHFVTHTVRFLNKFSGVCEEKLESLSYRIQRLEIMMNILEAKVSLFFFFFFAYTIYFEPLAFINSYDYIIKKFRSIQWT